LILSPNFLRGNDLLPPTLCGRPLVQCLFKATAARYSTQYSKCCKEIGHIIQSTPFCTRIKQSTLHRSTAMFSSQKNCFHKCLGAEVMLAKIKGNWQRKHNKNFGMHSASARYDRSKSFSDADVKCLIRAT